MHGEERGRLNPQRSAGVKLAAHNATVALSLLRTLGQALKLAGNCHVWYGLSSTGSLSSPMSTANTMSSSWLFGGGSVPRHSASCLRYGGGSGGEGGDQQGWGAACMEQGSRHEQQEQNVPSPTLPPACAHPTHRMPSLSTTSLP